MPVLQQDISRRTSYPAPRGKLFVPEVEYPGHDKMRVKIPFAKGSIEYNRIKAVYKKITDLSLLERCEGKVTQNPNESFHSRIWDMCPKVKYFSMPQMEFAVCQNILIYHMGYELGSLLSYFDIEYTQGMRKLYACSEYSRKRVITKKARKKDTKANIKRTLESYNCGRGDSLRV